MMTCLLVYTLQIKSAYDNFFPFLFILMSVCVLVTQLCPTLCDPMDYSPPGFSVHGILQARILEWIAIPFSRVTSQPRVKPWSPALQASSLPFELQGSPCLNLTLYRYMYKLKLQYFGHLMRTTDSFEKTLMLGKIEGRRGRGWQRMKWLDGITEWVISQKLITGVQNSMDMSLCELQKLVMDRVAWHAAVHGIAKSQTWLSNWTELNWIKKNKIKICVIQLM